MNNCSAVGLFKFLFQIACIHSQWHLIFVGTDHIFALLNKLLDFSSVVFFCQFFDGKFFLEYALIIEEVQFREEAFAEFLCFYIGEKVFWTCAKSLQFVDFEASFVDTFKCKFLGDLFLLLAECGL